MQNPYIQKKNVPGNSTILLVDNEKAVLGMIKKYLERESYQVVLAASGQEALYHFRRKPFFAVLLDLGLPDINGMEVLKEMKKMDKSIPVIMVTGNHGELEAREAMETGALEYLTKPINLEYLKNILSLQSMSES